MTVDLRAGKLRVSKVFVVSDQIDEAILGMDWMNQHKCLLDCGSNTLTIQDRSFEPSKKASRDCTHRVVSRISVKIPARTEALVPGKAISNSYMLNFGLRNRRNVSKDYIPLMDKLNWPQALTYQSKLWIWTSLRYFFRKELICLPYPKYIPSLMTFLPMISILIWSETNS